MVAEACENLAHNLTLKIISSVPLQQLIKEIETFIWGKAGSRPVGGIGLKDWVR